MKVRTTKIEGCLILEPLIFSDNRGFFFESFNQKTFNELINQSITFVQDNQSFSTKGVIRGLHAQAGEFAQSKLVRVLYGKVIDVAVDIRESSPTFGEHVAVELSHDNNLQLFIPRGFLHGFAVLSESALFAYKCDNYYNKSAEFGVRFDDDSLGINWNIEKGDFFASEKDLVLPKFNEVFK